MRKLILLLSLLALAGCSDKVLVAGQHPVACMTPSTFSFDVPIIADIICFAQADYGKHASAGSGSDEKVCTQYTVDGNCAHYCTQAALFDGSCKVVAAPEPDRCTAADRYWGTCQ